MFCKNCGANVPDGVAFCPNCGAQVNTSPKAAGSGDASKQTGSKIITVIICLLLLMFVGNVVQRSNGSSTPQEHQSSETSVSDLAGYWVCPNALTVNGVTCDLVLIIEKSSSAIYGEIGSDWSGAIWKFWSAKIENSQVITSEHRFNLTYDSSSNSLQIADSNSKYPMRPATTSEIETIDQLIANSN